MMSVKTSGIRRLGLGIVVAAFSFGVIGTSVATTTTVSAASHGHHMTQAGRWGN